MAQKSPWSVKGIDDRAREQAREKARAEGLTLGQYLNKLILEGAASPDDEDWLDELEGIEPANTDRTPQAEALHALTRRIEASEARSTLAITGIDQSVAGLVARIDQLQKGSNAVSMRIDGTTEEIKATQDALRERLTRLEGDDSNTRNVEALKSLESALGRLAPQVYDDTAKTESRQQALEQKLEEELFDVSSKVTALDERVDTTLTEAARKIEDAVRDAELRTEGSVKHLSERVGGIETTVADRLGATSRWRPCALTWAASGTMWPVPSAVSGPPFRG